MLKYTYNILTQQKILFIIIAIALPYEILAQEIKAQKPKSAISSVREMPRKDLYKAITRTAGVSLRQIFHLVFQKGDAQSNQVTFNKLSRYINKNGSAGIDKEYQQKIKSIKNYCDNQKQVNSSCYSQIEDLKKEQASLKKLKSQAKKHKKLAVYYYVTMLTHFIKTDIFRRANINYTKTCRSPQKINSDYVWPKGKVSVIFMIFLIN